MAQPGFHGRFIWTELLCEDIGAAVRFYTNVLAWTAEPFSPGSPYQIFKAKGGRSVAGAMALSATNRPGLTAHWRGYIGATDVDATVAKAQQLGAQVAAGPEDMPGVGRVAILNDPQGAVFGVFHPAQPADSGAPGEPGFAWFELAARQRESALAFYQQLFGWELRPAMDMGGGFYYQTFGLGSQDIGGAYTIPADRPMPPAWCPYASSASADAIAKAVVAAGGSICHGPVDVPGGGRIVQFFDPQHVMFATHSMAAAKPAAKPAAAKPAAAKPAVAMPAAAKPAAAKPAKAKAAPKKAAARKAPAKKAPAKKSAAKRAPTKVKKAKKKVVAKAARKPVRKVARKAGKKPAKKTTRKPAKKPVKKSSRKAAKKPARKK